MLALHLCVDYSSITQIYPNNYRNNLLNDLLINSQQAATLNSSPVFVLNKCFIAKCVIIFILVDYLLHLESTGRF